MLISRQKYKLILHSIFIAAGLVYTYVSVSIFSEWFGDSILLDTVAAVLCVVLTYWLIIVTLIFIDCVLSRFICSIEGNKLDLTNVTVTDTSDMCPICYELLNENTVSTRCSHQYHRLCIQKWADIQYTEQSKSLCPICNQNLLEEN